MTGDERKSSGKKANASCAGRRYWYCTSESKSRAGMFVALSSSALLPPSFLETLEPIPASQPGLTALLSLWARNGCPSHSDIVPFGVFGHFLTSCMRAKPGLISPDALDVTSAAQPHLLLPYQRAGRPLLCATNPTWGFISATASATTAANGEQHNNTAQQYNGHNTQNPAGHPAVSGNAPLPCLGAARATSVCPRTSVWP